MPRSLSRIGLVVVLAAGPGGAAAAQSSTLDVQGTTGGVPTAALPLFGSTAGACVLAATPEPYDPTDFATDTAGTHDLSVTEPVQTIPDTDDTVLLVYDGAFDPANACDNFLGVGNETVGSGLSIDLVAGSYVLVVAGFLGTEDPYTVRITGPAGSTITSDRVVSAEAPATEAVFALGPVSPNPAASGTEVPYSLREAGPVRVTVYDALGRRVALLADAHAEAGWHTVPLDTSALESGTYLVRLSAGGEVRTRPLTVAR